MYPGLSHGAYECLHAHGTDEQKRALPAEADQRPLDRHDVPDRAAVRHRPRHAAHQGRAAGRRQLPAHRQQDLHLRRRARPGREHRPPRARAAAGRAGRHRRASRCSSCRSGRQGATAALGERNGIWCGGLEHKMGIHGNATCADRSSTAPSARWSASRTRACTAMFVMMNAARLGVGMQSLGLTEVAYQNAAVYAKERLQMRSLSGPKAPDKPADPIIVHPDVRKMLLTARAYAEGGRALAMFTTLLLDRELAQRRRGRAQGLRRPGRAADADRQGLPDRQRAGSRPRTACRSSAATATSASGAWSSSCATRAST